MKATASTSDVPRACDRSLLLALSMSMCGLAGCVLYLAHFVPLTGLLGGVTMCMLSLVVLSQRPLPRPVAVPITLALGFYVTSLLIHVLA